MKKVRVEVMDESLGRRFWIFPSSLDLWRWIQSRYDDPSSDVKPDVAHEIILRPGGFIEAEWWGCEIMQDPGVPGGWRHLNLVRMGEVQPSFNASGNVITIHMGWLIDTILPMYDYDDDNIEVWRVDGDESSSELDLDALFKEKGIDV